jgi:hypothetical protein
MKTLVCALLTAVFAVTALAADVTGKWSGSFAPEGHDPSNAFMILKQAGTTLTGSAGPDEGEQWPISNGKIDGGKITGDLTAPDGAVYKLDLVLDSEHIKGDVSMTREGETRKAKLDVTRVKS